MPRFNFGRPFVVEKSDFQIANFPFLRIFAKIDDFSIISHGYNFYGRGLCFWIMTLYIHDKAPVKK